MEPINNFLEVIDKRTSQNFELANLEVKSYQKALLCTFGALIINGVLLFLTIKFHQSFMIAKLETDVEERTEELSIKNSELADNEEKFRSLSEAAFEGIFLSDKGMIIEANKTMVTIFGYSATELLDLKPIDLVSPENRDEVEKNICSGYEETYEISGLRKDGSLFPLAAHGKMFFYKGQQVRVTAIRDLTEKKKAEEEIRKLQGTIPICMHCKEIRDDKGSWNQLEEYISEHSEAKFSHGICEKCLKKYYPEEAD